MALRLDSLTGMFLGLAVGDALGAAVEFSRRGSFAPVTGYRAGGPHRLKPGEWTDDTSMALALAESLTRSFSMYDQLRRYALWMQAGEYSVNGRCFDIGFTTRSAIQNFIRSQHPETAGEPGENASGNGSIMRLAPVVIRYAALADQKEWDQLAALADDAGRTTHASPICRSACRYLSLILAGFALGEDRETVLNDEWPPVARLLEKDLIHPALAPVVRGSFKTKRETAIKGSGYVVDSLEAALWSFWRTDNFEAAVLTAVNLGDDADTTGAVCGQIAGACYGKSGIPAPLLDGLAQRDRIEGLAEMLAEEHPDPMRLPERWRKEFHRNDSAPPAVPFDRSYWVVPGKLLAGCYPSDLESDVETERLTGLVDCGIRCVINLVEEHERNYDGTLLKRYEQRLSEIAAAKGAAMECVRISIRDVDIPTPETMGQILDTIDARIAAGRPVFVHCWGGRGRTGVVVGCYLARHGIAEGGEALKRIQELRRHEATGHLDSPQTAAQCEMVRSWKRSGEKAAS